MDVKLTSFDLSHYNSYFVRDTLATLNDDTQEPIMTQNENVAEQSLSDPPSNLSLSQGSCRNELKLNPSRIRSHSVVATRISCNSGKYKYCYPYPGVIVNFIF